MREQLGEVSTHRLNRTGSTGPTAAGHFKNRGSQSLGIGCGIGNSGAAIGMIGCPAPVRDDHRHTAGPGFCS